MIDTKDNWQFLPANLIAYGCHHSRSDNEFDRLVGFLLLDIGVEATLSIFRHQPKNFHKVKAIANSSQTKTGFHELVRIGRELIKNGMEADDWERIEYFHNTRNTLYHQGDGFTPWTTNIKDYADLAMKLIHSTLGVDITMDSWTESKVTRRQDGVYCEGFLGGEMFFSFGDMAQKLSQALDALADKISIIVEQRKPLFTSRRFLAEVKRINNLRVQEYLCGDVEGRVSLRAECRNQLSKLLDEDLTEDQEYVDQILADPRSLWFEDGLEALYGENCFMEFRSYQDAHRFIEEAPRLSVRTTEHLDDDGRSKNSISNAEEIYKKYTTLLAWANKVDQQVMDYCQQKGLLKVDEAG